MKAADRAASCQGNDATQVVGLGGERGSELVSNTSVREGHFKAIETLDDTVFELADGNMVGLAGATVESGRILHGIWTKVKLTSGSIVLYNS